MKTVIVFGATGTIGRQIVKECRAAGFSVTAVVRDRGKATAIFSDENGLILTEANPMDEQSAASLISGKDVVVSALGNMNFEDPTMVVAPFCRMLVKHIAPGRRFIIISGSGITLHDAHTLRRDLPGQPEALKYVRQDHWEAYTAVQPLDVDYTFVCPTMIEAADADDAYEVQELYFPKSGGKKVKSGNVGRLVASMITGNRYLRTRVAIADKKTPADAGQ